MNEATSVAWVGAALVPRDEARLSIDDFAVRYGAACFETMIVRHGRVFRLGRHLDRLEGGLRLMGVAPPARDALADAVDATLRANGLSEASVRLTVTAGSGHAPDLRAASAPALVVTVDPLPAGEPPPVRLEVSSVRVDEHRAWRAAKVAQFLPYLLARQEAHAAGADDALLLNAAGHVAETATANLFLLVDGGLLTPSLESGPLPGVTREAVLEVARVEGVPVAEASFGLDSLAAASAAFLASSLGLRGVASIRARPAAAGPGTGGAAWVARSPADPLWRRVQRAYESLVDAECGAPTP